MVALAEKLRTLQSEQGKLEPKKKQVSHSKKAKQLADVVKKLGITAGEWQTLSDKVFKLAFK